MFADFIWSKLLEVPVVLAQASTTVGGSSSTAAVPIIPLSTQVSNIYNFALLLGGLLAFGAVVYGAARYTLSAGSPSAQSDARDQITQALVGLVLLLGAYIVLNTINPSLTSFRLPVLKEIRPPTEAAPLPGQRSCSGAECKNSPQVSGVLSCIASSGKGGAPATTYQGQHSTFSCHFGGRYCGTSGSHAIDWGFNGLRSAGIKPQDMLEAAEECGAGQGVSVMCRCEAAEGTAIVDCSDPSANHIHCNVDSVTCGCN